MASIPLFDRGKVDLRRSGVLLQIFRIETVEAVESSEPQLPVKCRAARGREKVVTVQAVFGGVDLDDLFAVNVKHHQSDIGPHPQATAMVLQHIVDNLGVEPNALVEAFELSGLIIEFVEALVSADPEIAP